jgi:hypothetical protein
MKRYLPRRVTGALLGSFLTAVLACALQAVLPVPAHSQFETRTVRRPFDLSARQIVGSDGEILLVVRTAIDHRRLVFFRHPSGYSADYRIIIEIRGEDGRQVGGEVIEKNVTVKSYEMTRSAGMLSEVTKKIPITAGLYDLKVVIEVVKTSLRYERSVQVKILDRDTGLFEIADPLFSVPAEGHRGSKPHSGELVFSVCSGDVEEGYRILADEVFIGFEGWIRTGFTVVTPIENRTERYVEATVRIENRQKQIKAYTRKQFEVDDQGRGSFCVDFNVDDLPMGFYEVAAAVSIPNTTKKAVRSGNFTMLLGKAMFGQYYGDTLELLSYVVEDGDLDAMRSADPKERVARH